MAARPDVPVPRRGVRLQAVRRRPAPDRGRAPATDRPARAGGRRHGRRRRRRPAHRRPGDRADRRLLHADRRRPVRVRADRRHQRAVGHLRDGRAAGRGAQPRRVPAGDARRPRCCARSCAAAPTPPPRPARRSSAGTRSTTRSPSTAWRSPASWHPDAVLTNAGGRPGDALVLTKPLGAGAVATAIKRGLATPRWSSAAVAVMTTLNDARRRAGARGRRARAHRRHRLRPARPRARAGRGERRGGRDRRRRGAGDRRRARAAGDRRGAGRRLAPQPRRRRDLHDAWPTACRSRGGGWCATR